MPISITPAMNNTGPHSDSRDLVLLGNNVLVESDDGGIYFLPNPQNAAANQWGSFNGNTSNGMALGDVEATNAAYDSNSRVIVAGAQVRRHWRRRST